MQAMILSTGGTGRGTRKRRGRFASMKPLRTRYKLAAAGIAVAALAACAPIVPPAGTNAVADRAISVEHGPCFGFCPTYVAEVDRQDRIGFKPYRNTKVTTPVERQGRRGTFEEVAAIVAPLRPERPGEYDVSQQCDSTITDLSDYHVRWHGPDGVRQVRFYPGCVNSRTEDLNRRMEQALNAYGVDDLVGQQQ